MSSTPTRAIATTSMDADRLRLIADTLQRVYRTPRWRSHGDPVSELVATVLSQHTTDVNTERAFASLRACLPEWNDVATAPTSVVAAAIKSGGLANIKAPRIQAILRRIHDLRGSYALDHLATLGVGDARRWLASLPGVGPKTASCVLLFSLGRPAFPVDTHVHRVIRRLGLAPASASPELVQDAVERAVGPDRDALYRLHLDLIRHGRAVCRALHPRCEACILSEHCEEYARRREASAIGTA